MSKLYIIGNGFDLAHNRKTKYTDFAKFLKSSNNTKIQLIIKKFEEKAFFAFDYYMEKNGQLWSDIEHALDLMFQPEIIQDELEEYRKLNVSYGDDDFRSRDYHNQEIAIDEDYSFCRTFKKYLPKWVNFIHQTPCLPLYDTPFSSSDKFLCFNYTNTLEKTYNIHPQQILYIHGKWSEENLIIGHNTFYEFPKQTEDDIYEDIAGIRAFETVQNNVYKDVKHRISNSHEFFDNLISTDTIYVLGHSISDIDIDYFRAVKQNANSNAKWVVSFYGDDDKEIKKNKLQQLEIPDSNFELATIEQILSPLE